LARRLGRPQSVVSQFEAGKRRLDVVEFLLVVRTLGVNPVKVFTEIATSGTTGRRTPCAAPEADDDR
jgi:hypothetical protein